MSTSSKELAVKLKKLAEKQGGFFTARQAVEVGYADSVHGYHVRNGDWEKAQRGIYRLVSMDLPDWPELYIWSLWSCGRDDKPDGVYCRETALAIHGVMEREDNVLHMAVPSRFRRNSKIPDFLVLHKKDLPKSDVEMKIGVQVTTIERTLKDFEEGDINPKILSILRNFSKKETKNPVEKTEKVEWEGWNSEMWEKTPTPIPMWSRGMTFDEAIQSGED